MDMDWEHEQTIIKEKHEILQQKLQEAKQYKKDAEGKNQALMDEKMTHDIQVQAQSLEKAKLIEDNKKAKIEFLRNEESMIEYQTLTFKQSKKIQELKDEIKELNTKFPEEVAKYTKELEFLKFDNESKKTELEFTYQSKKSSSNIFELFLPIQLVSNFVSRLLGCSQSQTQRI